MMQEETTDIRLFNQLFSEYRKRFTYYACSYLQDEAAAEDVVTDSFIYFWENRHTLVLNQNVPAYILKVVKHKCLNYLRSQSVRLKAHHEMNGHQLRILQTRIMTLEACDPQELFREEASGIVERALAMLPAQTKEIFARSRHQNQNYQQIAADLGVSVKTVEFHISKALKILRSSLKDYFLFFLILLSKSNF